MEKDISVLIGELFGGKFQKEFTPQDIARIVSQNRFHTFFEYDGERIISMVILYTVETFSRHVAVIEEVVTLPAYRNQGISTKLIERAIQRATEIGCSCVELTVREDNQYVYNFYKKMGFVDRYNRSMRMSLNK